MSSYLDKSGLGYLWGKIKALVPALSKKTSGIPFGQVDGTSTSTKFTATIDGITEYADGVCVMLKNGVVTSASGFTININGLGAKPVYSNLAAASAQTTIFNINYTMLFVYNSTRVTGGCWDIYLGYDSNTNTIGYQLRTNSTVLKTYDKFRYYRLLFTSADGTHWIPANTGTDNSATSAKTVNQRPIDPFGRIVYCSVTTSFAAEADITATGVWDQYVLALGYSFNTTGAALAMTTKRPVYLKCAPQSDGSAIIDSATPYVQALPSTEDGKIYIFLGIAYSATNIELVPNHPIYYYKDSAIRIWTNAAASGGGSVAWNDITGKPTFATVATSGDYDDLTDKPTIPTKTSDLQNDSGFITGVDWTDVTGKPTFATVATSGDYDDLTDKPTIPTKTSDLQNDSGFISNLVELTYNSSTWNDFITAYNGKKVVYCNASGRKAFMAYVNNNGVNPTEVEFQYYRSRASHTDSYQGDQVIVYKLTSAGTWTLTTRNAYTMIDTEKGLTDTYTTGTVDSVASSGILKIKANLRSETKLTNDSAAATETANRVYPVALDKSGYLSVNVPWTDSLPSVSSADNGKFLVVDNGAWAAITVPDANGNSF